jgi:hypothetical protein
VATLGVVGVIVVVLLVLYLIPFPNSFSFAVPPIRPGLGAMFDPPSGSYVKGSWFAVHGIRVNLVVQDSLDVWVYSSYATNGSFTFTASHPPYEFYVSSSDIDTVQVNGTYYTPMW